MRDQTNEKYNWMNNHLRGVGASFATFCIIWPIDTTSTRLRFYHKNLFDGGARQFLYRYRDAISPDHTYTGLRPLIHSFFNVGFYWGFAYMLSAGLLTLPLQKDFEKKFLQVSQASNENTIIFYRALAGWCAALIQLSILHPIDSLKVTAQKNPKLLSDGSVNYFLKNQSQLRRGTGVVALGSITHFIAWHAKLYTQLFLKDKTNSVHQQQILSSLAFSVTHILLAFPINTIKTWAQGDMDFHAKDKTFLQKTNRTMELVKNNVKIAGPSVLYRGIFSRGSMHAISFAVQMSLFEMSR